MRARLRRALVPGAAQEPGARSPDGLHAQGSGLPRLRIVRRVLSGRGDHARARRLIGSLLFEHELARIVGHAVDADLVVQVRSGAAAGVADGGDELSALHLLAELHVDPREVAIARLEAVAV